MTALTLPEFLLARYAEDEAAARAADPAVWVNNLAWKIARLKRAGAEAAHIARHGPVQVLADLHAKRRIVERCTPLADMQVRRQTRTLAHDALLALALPYADHPDFREEWRP